MRACIYGAGAMGTVLGAFIARAGKKIDLFTRNREHVAALNACGAAVGFSVGGGGFAQKVAAFLPGEMEGKYDVIFLMTKQRENGAVVSSLRDHLADDGVICTMQNGLPEELIASVVGRERTLGCAVSWGASYISPGCVMLTSSPDAMTFSLGSPFGENDAVEGVKELLECAGRVETVENFIGARWSKLIVNSAFSSLSAVTGCTFGEIARGRTSRALAQALFKEGIDTALANGVTPAKIQGHDLVGWLNYRGALKKAVSYMLIPFAMKKHSDLISGMYFDLSSGKKSDMQFICGAVAAHARERDVEVPVTDAVLMLASGIEEGELTVSPENILRLTAVVGGKK